MKRVIERIVRLFKRADSEPAPTSESAIEEIPCCGTGVHIAFRGISDDRLYLARDRKWVEVRYYKPHGLRVFCAGCRHRLI